MTTSRRSVIKAAAWAAPAVVVATKAPAYATSGTPPKGPTLVPSCTDTPGSKKKVRLSVRIEPHRTAAVTIGGALARYDRHHGYYVDVQRLPTRPVVVTATWIESGRVKVISDALVFKKGK